ncbi:hypothetical protein [Streptomyces sp. AP-93]|uniref:hypothetical protein n=1 Tax=Streptomyces sp. AP-93 TaxID=2929048 RepID=UPI001FAF5469|nr:hypothetical protein [Streptomyces sp. AP-93]MCJ0871732.1 hypothetical protein [Streptomyces sp. AP-93]
MARPQPIRRASGAQPPLVPVSDTGEEFRETLTEKFADLIGKTPVRGRPVQQVDVSVRVTQRAPHEMYGTVGFSAVSNEFLSEVLAVLMGPPRGPLRESPDRLHGQRGSSAGDSG